MNDSRVANPEKTVDVANEAELAAVARRLATAIELPLTVYLRGDLGAGKTTFVRALLHALGHGGRVKSPTYGLLEIYELPIGPAIHLDLYRLTDPAELDFLGLADALDRPALLLVEWPEQGRGHLPPADLVLALTETGRPGGRRLFLSADSGIGEAVARRAFAGA